MSGGALEPSFEGRGRIRGAHYHPKRHTPANTRRYSSEAAPHQSELAPQLHARITPSFPLKAVVTGGAGFIGSNLAALLCASEAMRSSCSTI